MLINYQNIYTWEEIGVAKSERACRSVKFVEWHIVGLIIKAQNNQYNVAASVCTAFTIATFSSDYLLH